jgi:hypothetical protein
MINRLTETNEQVQVQDTTFSTDVLGRYICNTWNEAVNNGGMPFDAVVIGAGMFGAYCAEKIYRKANLRVLVLDAGSLLVTEHVQNLARIGLNAAGPKKDPNGKVLPVINNADDPGTRESVWGIPWRSNVPFPGLAYCLGGRSLYWGGWAPRLIKDDLNNWPQEIRDYLQNPTFKTCPDDPLQPPVDEYCRTEREIGVVPSKDYISGELVKKLADKLNVVKGSVPTVDAIEDAPLAVQAEPPASGLFSFDKWSSAPIFVDAVREDAVRAISIDPNNPDWQRRLFYVPRAHVTKLHTANGLVHTIEVWVNNQPKFLNISPQCAVVLANGTIESTRLALESFPTPLMGRNLMAHLRSDTIVRIHRSALGIAPTKLLQAAALLVRGSTPQGRYHIQITAAAVPKPKGSEDTMFRAIPDIDLLEQTLASQKDDWVVITLRAIGEMTGDPDPTKPKITGMAPSWMDLSDQTESFPLFSNSPVSQVRRAWVNLVANNNDNTLWAAMNQASLALAKKLADDDMTKFELVKAPTPDGLGTTHHEAGTLWMGNDANKSVTNLDGRFHHIANAYVAGPAIFPAIGSANPSLTALTLARKTAMAIVKQSLPVEPGFTLLGTGGLEGWRMAGSGNFMELGSNIIESVGGTGLLWYTREEFENFILRLDWQVLSEFDNSGIYFRFPALNGDVKPADTQGYEVQIDERGIDPQGNSGSAMHSTGAIYGLAPSNKPHFPLLVGKWNTFEIEAVGSSITTKLNGQIVSNLINGNRSLKGHIGLQSHHPGSRSQFRNIRIKKL